MSLMMSLKLLENTLLYKHGKGIYFTHSLFAVTIT